VSEPEVKVLFEELRAEEAEHVQMIESIIRMLPLSVKVDLDDEDSFPNSNGRTFVKDRF
jgi:rubrerythrin